MTDVPEPFGADPSAADHGPTPVPESLVRLFEHPAPGLEFGLPHVTQGLAAWRDTLSIGRLLAAAALTPLLFGAYRGAITGAPPNGIGWMVLLLAVAAIGSLALATYLPQRLAGAGASPCASIAAVWVLFAWITLNAPADPANGALSLLMVSLALFQRLRGATACGAPSR